MNYIYDILINLQKNIYDFYEWNLNDEILHIRKIPLIKISTKDLFNIKNNLIQLKEENLKMIQNRTEIFANHNIRIIKYLSLFSDDKDVLAVEFDKNGIKSRVSKLLIDEELEVIEVSEHINISNIKYEIKEANYIENFKTRKELKIYDYIMKQLNKDNYAKLKYLYFDCFDKEETDYQVIIRDLKKELNNNWKSIYDQVYKFLKLSSQKQ